MKRRLSAVLLILGCCGRLSAANKTDTIMKGINIEFNYSASVFPFSWRDNTIDATGEAISPEEIDRTKSIISNALKKYPDSVLSGNLKTIYCLKTMTFYQLNFGGTNSDSDVYITNNGTALGYTNTYIEQTFHHEFSSVLLRNYISLFDSTAWKNVAPAGFDYNDPEDGVGAIRNNQSSQEADTLLCKKGLLTQYAGSSLENDVNTIAQNLFCPAAGFWKIVDSYPLIGKKVNLLVLFYQKIDNNFSETYFRKFENPI